MNVTFAIYLVAGFALLGEILTWIVRNQNTFTFGYVSVVRIMVTCLSICTIIYVNDEHKDYEAVKDANMFKYELVLHQDSLINYQRTMIDDLANTLWHDYNDDLPQFDGDLKDRIDFEEQYLDSLYNTQL